MSSPVLRLFGSYEFFGKAIPGAVAMLGLLMLLSPENFPEVFSGELLNIAALLLILLISGLMAGEAVHTLAENIEKLFHWIARRGKGAFTFIRAATDSSLNINTLRYTGGIEEKRLSVRWCLNSWNQILEWFRRRYWGTYDSLVSHRQLLGKGIEWNFNPSDKTARWAEGEKGRMFEMFAEDYQSKFTNDIRKLTPNEIVNQYPLITGSLEAEDHQGFRHFQAIYSFCRSMWVLLFIYGVVFFDLVYTRVLFGDILLVHTPIILEILTSDFERGLPILLFIGTILFFDAAGTYKRHFIEYLMAEFITQNE